MKTIPIITIFLVLAFMSCRNYHAIEGNHNVEQEVRNIQNFSKVHSSDEFEVYITESSVYEVTVEAEENLIPYIETEKDGDELKIEVKRNRRLDNNYPIKVFVSAPHFSEIHLSGSGTITTDSLHSNYIDYEISGSGKIYSIIDANKIDVKISGSGRFDLSGDVSEADVIISGSGKFSAYECYMDTCFCDISGSGKMYINVSDYLDVRISGSGSVYYKGNPIIRTSISGSGHIINEN